MVRAILITLVLIVALLASRVFAAAQEATPAPDATPGAGCDVIPRGQDELIALRATPLAGATPVAMSPIALPEGDPVDAATLNTFDETMRDVIACAELGDIGRLLALYSDHYVANVALAPEPVPIIPGQPREPLPAPPEEPSPAARAEPRVETAVRLPDGRIAAVVTAGGLEGTEEIVMFSEERGRWVIDEIRPAQPRGPLGTDLPFPVQAAVASAAAEFDVALVAVTVESYEMVEWPDTSLGCPQEGEFYAQVITPGYRVTLTINGQQHQYHTDEFDRAIRCDPE